jgi:hypothetical protein
MLIFLLGLLVGAVTIERILAYWFPENYAGLSTLAWGIEGLLALLVVAGLVYQYFTGHPF